MENDENLQPSQQAPGTGPGSAAKKLYRKPAFRHERVFETRALICGKINDTQHSCRTSKKVS